MNLVKEKHARIQREGQGVRTAEKSQNIGFFFSNTGPDLLKNHKATRPSFNIWPSSARQRNGPMVAHLKSYLDPTSPHQHNKNVIKVGPPLTKLPGSAHEKQ